MADLTKTIEIIFAGVNQTGTALQDVGKGLNSLESSVGNLTGPLAGLSSSLLTAEAAILATGAAMVGVAVNEAGQFYNATAEIGTLFNGTAEQVDGLSNQIINYARTSTASFEEIEAAVYKAISTGTDYTDAVQLVADAEVLATAGRANLADVTAVLTSSLNAYGASTQQAADYSDSLFAAVQSGNTTLPELASSLGSVTGIAAAAGVPFSDLVAALSALTITSGNTAESTTLLRGILTALVDPTDELKAALGDVTIEGDGLQAVMQRLQEVTNGDAEAMSQLFGNVRALTGSLALANDNSGAFANALDAQANRAGIAAAANDVLAQSFESINTNLLNNVKATLIEFGGPILDEYRDVALSLASIFNGLSISLNAGAFDEVYAAFDQLGLNLSDTLRGIADALPAALEQVDFTGLLDALNELQISFGNIFGDLDFTQPEDLARAIQFLVDGFESLTRVSAAILEPISEFIQKIGLLIEDINSSDTPWQTLLGNILGTAQILDAALVPALGIAGDALNGIAGIVLTLSGAKYLGATTAGFGSMATSVGALASALQLGPAALIAALGFTVYAFTDFYDSVQRTNALIEENRQSTQNWIKAFEETTTWEEAVVRANELGESVSHLNEEFLNSFGVTADAVAQYGSVADAQAALTAQYGSLEAAERKQREALEGSVAATEQKIDADQRLYQEHLKTIEAAQDLATNYDAIVDSVSEQTRLTDLQAQSTEDLAKAFQLMTLEQRAALSTEERNTYIAAVEATYDANTKATDATKQLTQAELEAKLTAEQISEARLKELEILKDFELQMEEIASNERIRYMEFAFNLDIEKLQADTEKAVAIFEGLETTIESTGTLLGELFGYLLEADSFSERWAIDRQIDLENQRRQDALDLQKALTEKQIEYMDAQIDALGNGDALIKIQADGLEPELRAFMYRILDNIRVEMTKDNLAFITGVT